MHRTILHTINQSPFTSQLWPDCLDAIGSDDCLVLINDGVYGAIKNQPYQHLLNKKSCYAIKEELEKRGINQLDLNTDIELITYEQWVELAIQHPLSQSWY